MKEQVVLKENADVASGSIKKGKAAKSKRRAPLSNKTNNLGHKSQEVSQHGQDDDDLKILKSNKSRFAVYEDSAAADGRPVSPTSPLVSCSDQQTQTEPEPNTSDQKNRTEPEPSTSDQKNRTGPESSDVDRLVADMCAAEEPSGQYWRQLADTRQRALDEALAENQQLHQRLATLEEQNRLLKDVVQQAENVMAAVQEWSEEQEQEQETSRQ